MAAFVSLFNYLFYFFLKICDSVNPVNILIWSENLGLSKLGFTLIYVWIKSLSLPLLNGR